MRWVAELTKCFQEISVRASRPGEILFCHFDFDQPRFIGVVEL